MTARGGGATPRPPAAPGARVPLAAALARLRAGFSPPAVAGRLSARGGRFVLSDASGEVEFEVAVAARAGARPGDLVAGRLGDGVLEEVRVLARAVAPPLPEDAGLAARLPLLERRARVVDAVRGYFRGQGFLEVTTPHRVVCPGLEPHLVAQPAGDRWLITSPELHLKRLLAAGAERVFEIARAWRGDEHGPWHLPEFAMLEWYRAYEGLDALEADVLALLDAAGCRFARPPERLTVREAFSRHAGLDLAALRDPRAFGAAAGALGVRVAPGDDWDDVFFRVFLERVEPHLGRDRVTVLAEYPASQAALARVRPDPEFPVALRFEVYASGVELANAFDELTDPCEQRRRHEADRAWRAAHGREAPPLDEAFLAALAAGHPPAAGIALGLDRLVALALGENDLARVVPFAG